MTTEQQIAALVAIGYTLPDTTRTVQTALALVPDGADPALWLPSAEALDAPINDADVMTARNEWYATAPDEYARLLDAGEAVPDA